MRYVTHETREDEGRTVWALTVAVRRWWAPWTWKQIELLAEAGAWAPPTSGQWTYRDTGKSVFYERARDASALLRVTLIEQRRVDNLLSEDEPPKLRALTGGRR